MTTPIQAAIGALTKIAEYRKDQNFEITAVTMRKISREALAALQAAPAPGDTLIMRWQDRPEFEDTAAGDMEAAMAEIADLRAHIAQRAASADGAMSDFLTDLARSRAKYPRNRTMFDGLMGEVDELVRAYHGDGDVSAEALDVAVCAFRIASDGDAGGNAHPLLTAASADEVAIYQAKGPDAPLWEDVSQDTYALAVKNNYDTRIVYSRPPAPKASAPDAPAGDLPPLPVPSARLYVQNGYRRASVTPGPGEPLFTAADLRACVRADRAARQPDINELHFNAQRLRNVATMLGFDLSGGDDATVDNCRGAILGNIAAVLRDRATAAPAGHAEPVGWTVAQVWAMRERLLEQGICLTALEPTREMNQAGCTHGVEYLNHASDIWAEMMSHGPGGDEFDSRIAAILNAGKFVAPVATEPAPRSINRAELEQLVYEWSKADGWDAKGKAMAAIVSFINTK